MCTVVIKKYLFWAVFCTILFSPTKCKADLFFVFCVVKETKPFSEK